MTSRLKKRLDNFGVDPSSSRATESFCLIGTPLPPLEKAKDQNEFVPVWKQDVRDEQGRRRLHGAFTGGFSAGYFNSVGSKEGWTPQTFKSSRTARASTSKTAKPEDFMDEEDLAELRESRTIVDKTEEMDLLGGTQGELSRRPGPSMPDDDPLASALADSLLPPPRDSAGAVLLRKMGWRPGQGVGPRVTYDQLRKQDLQSSDLPISAKTEEMDQDDEAKKHTFAPRDTKVIVFRPRETSFGLGYVPGASLSESTNRESQAGPSISAGFGLGALNDAEDDDVDVYDSSVSQRSNRAMAYDAEDSNEKLTLGSERLPHRTQQQPRQERAPASSYTFHDGRPVLAGFMLSDKPVVEETWFKIPDVPKGWKPNPYKVWSSSTTPTAPSIVSVLGRPDSSRFKSTGRTLAEERGAQLGESGLPSLAPRSVFDYLSEKDRARIQNLTGNAPEMNATASTSSSEPPSAPARSTITIPSIESPIAQAALRGFQPFTTDPVKQSRYTAYLRSQCGPVGSPDRAPPPERKAGQSVDEYNHEMEDYAKSAMIFKPMSGAMANRFTSAAIIDTGPKIKEGLHMPAQTPATPDSSIVDGKVKSMEVEETPKQHAARMGMYGPLTRDVQDWAPARLLCKRFGIKNPRPDPIPNEDGAPFATTGTESSAFEEPTTDAAGAGSAVPAAAPARSGPKDISNIGLGEDDDQGRDTLTYERPSMDIFKAIFASDDEDSDDDEEEASKQPDTLPSITTDTHAVATTLPPTHTPTANIPDDDTPVDLSSFKPKFVPKSHRDKDGKGKNGDVASSSKSKSRKSEGKVKKSLVSFGMDEDGSEGLSLSVAPETKKPKKRKDKDREKKRSREDDPEDNAQFKRPRPVDATKTVQPKDDDDEWVEKSPPPAGTLSSLTAPDQRAVSDSHRASRPRASDFL